MKTFTCCCGNTLFFENSRCLNCNREVGWCPFCQDLTALIPLDNHQYQCSQTHCQALLQKCTNFFKYQVCNRCLEAEAIATNDILCDYCSYNDTIPDLAIEGNLDRWYQLETAKRRLLYTLERLKLPLETAQLSLAFDFKGDVILKDALWRTVGKKERVYTGHADGKITINIQEADAAEREKLRVDMNESHRTLVGHFHHEIGHYYWQMLVKNHWLDRFIELFGDPEKPPYAEAMETYYEQGAPKNWQDDFVSAYATMHPWEDFAETFAAYLDMIAVLDTAQHLDLENQKVDINTSDLSLMLTKYTAIGVVLNEMNRTLGLIDFLPDIFTPKVTTKLNFVHDLLRAHSLDSHPQS